LRPATFRRVAAVNLLHPPLRTRTIVRPTDGHTLGPGDSVELAGGDLGAVYRACAGPRPDESSSTPREKCLHVELSSAVHRALAGTQSDENRVERPVVVGGERASRGAGLERHP